MFGFFVTLNINGEMLENAVTDAFYAVVCEARKGLVCQLKQRKRISGESRDKSKVEPEGSKRSGVRVIYAS